MQWIDCFFCGSKITDCNQCEACDLHYDYTGCYLLFIINGIHYEADWCFPSPTWKDEVFRLRLFRESPSIEHLMTLTGDHLMTLTGDECLNITPKNIASKLPILLTFQ